jgi:glycosyltransferase involved in cell wall biosynthesis
VYTAVPCGANISSRGLTMKIMFICSARQMGVEMIYHIPQMAQLSHEFIISPLVRLCEKEEFGTTIRRLGHLPQRVSVDPIYLLSPDMGYRNLLNPKVLKNDFLSIFDMIERRKPDSVICYYVLHAYPLVLLKKILGFSLAVVAQGSDIALDNSLLQRHVRKLVCKNSDVIFACSWNLKDEIERLYDRSVVVVPSSADSSFFRPFESKSLLYSKWNMLPGKRIILSVCFLHKLKAVDLMIKSLLKLSSSDINLLVAGDGEEREALEKLASSLGLQERVFFLGRKNREELRELYNLADVYAQISYSEGLPRALVEAMACGCIPIVTNVGSMAALVSDGFNGFVINPGNIDEFVVRVNEVLSFSEEKTKLMQSRARKTVKDNFDSRKIVEKMVDEIVKFHSRAR